MMPKSDPDLLRPLRRRALVAWVGWWLSVGFLWFQHRWQVLHPYALPWLLLLALTFGGALAALVRGLWRLLRGPQRRAALAWALAGSIPALLWLTLAGYGFQQWGKQQVPHNLPFLLTQMAGASLMETQARFLYPHRLESQRLVMFFDDRVTDPENDIQEMDRHVATLEEKTGLSLRTKIYLVRGKLLGLSGLSLLGLALGSRKSPANNLDRHELAHAVLYQLYSPDTDPPMLLVEGWAESQSQNSKTLAKQALWYRHSQGQNTTSLVRELTDSVWYHHDAGPVYPVGGAFVNFLLQKYGMQRFVDLYFTCRPETFAADCQRIYATDLDTLEKQFWEDAERLECSQEHATRWRPINRPRRR